MTESIRVYFATNRRKRPGKFGNRFHDDGPAFFRVGKADVSFHDANPRPDKRDWNGSSVTWETYPERKPAAVEPDPDLPPEMHRKSVKGERPGSLRMLHYLRDAATGGDKACRNVLIYLHGFANSFENSMARAAQLKILYTFHDLDMGQNGRPRLGEKGAEAEMFAFAWPANGRVQPPWNYFSDRDDAKDSGTAMARALCRLLDFIAAQDQRCPVKLHLVAHSMGNWALRHALQALPQLSNHRIPPRLFENVFLMAADEDEDALEDERKLGPLLTLAKNIHVYHSRDDDALLISDTTKGNPDRLGTGGPRNLGSLPNRVVAVDCSDVSSLGGIDGDHQYYRSRPEVLQDIRHVLAGARRDQIPNRRAVEPGRRYAINPWPG